MTTRHRVGLVAVFLGGLATVTASAADVDTEASDKERVKALWGTINQVVGDLDSAGQENKKKFLLHVAWHESRKLKTRKQDDNGPARSFYQMERAKAIDAVDYAKTKGWVGKLSAAAGGGTTDQQVLAAFDQLKLSPATPAFPDGNLIKTKLETNDLFGTYMARIALLRVPAAIGTGNQAHAEYWAEHWKKVFANDAEREKLIMRFKEAADEVDGLIP